MNNNDDNINEIAEGIFNFPAKPPSSIQLQFEEQTADFANQDGFENFLFNILFLITFKGIEILYGHRDILKLTKRQYENVNDYVKSYGYKLVVTVNGTNDDLWEYKGMIKNYQISFEKYNLI